jgi:hypothetical protein
MPDNQDDKQDRFNPFINEADMFKVLLYVAAGCAIVALLALLVRTIL